jgi:hypothetical protein
MENIRGCGLESMFLRHNSSSHVIAHMLERVSKNEFPCGLRRFISMASSHPKQQHDKFNMIILSLT